MDSVIPMTPFQPISYDFIGKKPFRPRKIGEIPLHSTLTGDVTTAPKILIQGLHMRGKRFRKTFPKRKQDQQLPSEGHQGFSNLIFAGNTRNDSRVFFTSRHLFQFQRAHPESGNHESLGNVCSGWTWNFPPPGDEAWGDSWVTATP